MNGPTKLLGTGMAVFIDIAIFGVLSAGCNHPVVQAGSVKITPGNGQVQSLLFLTMDVSPDGKTIVFSGTRGGGTHLYLLNLTANKVTQLTQTTASDGYPAFSPDGKTIVYQSSASPSASRHLFLISINGGSARQLTNAPATSDESPHFSPNGEKITFSRAAQFHAKSALQSTSNGIDVWVVNRNGTQPVQVTHLKSDGVMRPRFYPDNRHVIFEKTTITDSPVSGSGVKMSLATADTAGKEPIRETVSFSGSDFSPCFYPNGKQIVFGGNFGGTLDLYRVTLPGGKPAAILPARRDTGFCNPVVTSDGKSIYCLERYTPDLYKMNIDGSNLHKIADSSLFSNPMHWKP